MAVIAPMRNKICTIAKHSFAVLVILLLPSQKIAVTNPTSDRMIAKYTISVMAMTMLFIVYIPPYI